MKVTEIKSQVRRAGRYSVFIDGKYSFSLSESGLLEHQLFIGQELTMADAKRLKQAAGDDKLYGNVLRFVTMRPRSEWEIRNYLQRKQASPALTDQTLNRLSVNGFVDDVKFARAWVESCCLLHPASKRKLQQELRAKHVSDEVIRQVLVTDEHDEQAALCELIAKKGARYPDKLKLMQYLVRQGFNYQDVKDVLNEAKGKE